MDWLLDHRIVFEDLALVSAVVGIVSLAGVALVLLRLPEDYFVGEHRHPLREQREVDFSFVAIVKNALGLTMILLGIAMLVLPGQGMLFVLAGLFLTNFPGKFRLERRIIRNPMVSGTVNRLREGFGRSPLVVPEKHEKVADSPEA